MTEQIEFYNNQDDASFRFAASRNYLTGKKARQKRNAKSW